MLEPVKMLDQLSISLGVCTCADILMCINSKNKADLNKHSGDQMQYLFRLQNDSREDPDRPVLGLQASTKSKSSQSIARNLQAAMLCNIGYAKSSTRVKFKLKFCSFQ